MLYFCSVVWGFFCLLQLASFERSCEGKEEVRPPQPGKQSSTQGRLQPEEVKRWHGELSGAAEGVTCLGFFVVVSLFYPPLSLCCWYQWEWDPRIIALN